MRVAIACVVMALAARCFGKHRRDWASAMEAELQAAIEEGESLSFASGCLLRAIRELPAHEDGRFAIASHVLALGIIIPIAGLMLISVGQGYPFLAPNEAGTDAILGTGRPMLVNAANQTGLPLLTLLTFVLGSGHLWVAWAMLDRDWSRVASLGTAAAALTSTVVMFTGILFWSDPCALPQAAMTAVELLAIWSLIRWHGDLPDTGLDMVWPHPA